MRGTADVPELPGVLGQGVREEAALQKNLEGCVWIRLRPGLLQAEGRALLRPAGVRKARGG